jgi:hypothetical protein
MTEKRFSRPIRAGATLLNSAESDIEYLFNSQAILIRLEPSYVDSPDAQETFFFTVNQCLRFCSTVYVDTPPSGDVLAKACLYLGAVPSKDFKGLTASTLGARKVALVVNVGSEVLHDIPWTCVNSNGWVARIATGCSGASRLPTQQTRPNPIGALAASCFGAEAAFFALLGLPKTVAFEISLHTHQQGDLGSLPTGPDLPKQSLRLDGFLIGCGSVTNGWAYAMSRLPVSGYLQAVDHQSVQEGNFGSYVCAQRSDVGEPKVDIIRRTLITKIRVEPRPEPWAYFKIRLRYGLTVPKLVVCGLDNVETRHSVQALWPEMLVDMGAGGLTSQVIVKRKNSAGLCILRALDRPADEISWAQSMSFLTGLSPDRVLQGNTFITEEDVAKASPHLREDLARAKAAGLLLCGRLTQYDLKMEAENPDFRPAIPFVTAFTGIVAAAETIKWLRGESRTLSLYYQRSFKSDRSAPSEMLCDTHCECQRHIVKKSAREPRPRKRSRKQPRLNRNSGKTT